MKHLSGVLMEHNIYAVLQNKMNLPGQNILEEEFSLLTVTAYNTYLINGD